jgi:hypothetical protein
MVSRLTVGLRIVPSSTDTIAPIRYSINVCACRCRRVSPQYPQTTTSLFSTPEKQSGNTNSHDRMIQFRDNPLTQVCRPLQKPHTHQKDVAFVEQELGEVGAVLAGDAGDEGNFGLGGHFFPFLATKGTKLHESGRDYRARRLMVALGWLPKLTSRPSRIPVAFR